MEKLREENRNLCETHYQEIRETKEKNQTLEKTATDLANVGERLSQALGRASESLNNTQVCVVDFLSALLLIKV